MQVGQLFIALGFDVDDEKLKGFKDGISSLQKEMFKLSATAAAGVYAINRFLNEPVRQATQLRRFAAETGLATEELERFSNVAMGADPSLNLDATITGFRNLATVLDEIRRKGNYPEGALWMGLGNLSGDSDPADVIRKIYADMPNILRRLGNDGTAQGLQRAKVAFSNELSSLGIGSLAPMFSLPPEKFREFWNMAIPTREQRESMNRIADAYFRFNVQFSAFKNELGARIEPYWVKAIDNSVPTLKEFVGNMEHLAKIGYETFTSFNKYAQGGIILWAGLLLARLNPLTAALTALITVWNEVSKIAQGKDSWLGTKWAEFFLGVTQGMQSDPNSTIGLLKRGAADALAGEGVLSDEELNIHNPKNIMSRAVRPTNSYDNSTSNNNVNVAPVYNITTSEDLESVESFVFRNDQNVLESALSNTGMRSSGLRVGGY